MSTFARWLDALDTDAPTSPPSAGGDRQAGERQAVAGGERQGTETAEAVPDARELVIDRATGRVRQAGAASAEGAFVLDFRRRAERSLYVFAKGVLGLTRLTRTLHRSVCAWLTRMPPYRKLLLLPRDHLKTSMAVRALPMHMLIQPAESNLYMPGRDGATIRVLLAAETATNAQAQLGWIKTRFESSEILRGLWPHRCWDHPLRESRKWSGDALLLPRPKDIDYPEASIETIGVGGAVTGRHYDVMVKDDLTTLEAANSPLVMEAAIEWHEASRALLDDHDRGIEVVIGTRWAVHDVYAHIIDTDPTVEVMRRAVVEDGVPIFPEMFSLDTIAELQKRLGTLFPLLYMNEASDPSLTDFDRTLVRLYRVEAGEVVFDEDDRDVRLTTRLRAPAVTIAQDAVRGMRLGTEAWDILKRRAQYIRFRT